MPDQVQHDRIQNLVSTVSIVVGLITHINHASTLISLILVLNFASIEDLFENIIKKTPYVKMKISYV